jgi:hypothetical protein
MDGRKLGTHATKLDRDARAEAYEQGRHRVKTRFEAGRYRAVCSCLWRGEARSDRSVAEQDGAHHEAAIA